MSARMMTKQCVHCKRKYRYSPTLGDMGTICKYCHKTQIQTQLPTIPHSKNKQVNSKVLKKLHR